MTPRKNTFGQRLFSAWTACVLLASVISTLSPLVAQQEDDAAAERIQGTVVDEQGQPVARARLWYEYAFSRRSSERLSVTAKSDGEGKFTLDVPLGSADGKGFVRYPSCVWAFATGHCLGSATVNRNPANTDPAGLRIELAPATDTSLQVLDPDGEPVAGVIVEPLNYRTTRGFDLVPDGAKPLCGARTDELGRVHLPALAREHMLNARVTTTAYGVQIQRFTVHPDQPAKQTVRLRPVCRIEGRVIAENPELTRGIRFLFTTEEKWLGAAVRPPWPTEGHADVTTDESGRFEVPIIAAGQVSIIDTVIDEELPVRPELPERVDLAAGETTFLKMPLRELVDIRGSIRTEDTSQPLPDIEVHVYYGRHRQGTDAVSDAKGQFSARVLPGSVRFQLQNLYPTKYLQLGSPQPHDVPPDANDLELPAIEVVPSKPLEGRVVDKDDVPIADAQVFAYYRNWMCSFAKTEQDGRFTLPKMPHSVAADKATYRVGLGIGETRYMQDGGVEIMKSDPLVLRARR